MAAKKARKKATPKAIRKANKPYKPSTAKHMNDTHNNHYKRAAK
ncbi:hypothetical protein P4489_06685 [Heyndrickxia sporothermodurans]|nr:hypothetical protein [Heyndrickxia sporothermodurans]